MSIGDGQKAGEGPREPRGRTGENALPEQRGNGAGRGPMRPSGGMVRLPWQRGHETGRIPLGQNYPFPKKAMNSTDSSSNRLRPVAWAFPLPCCHEGLPFGNSVVGDLVWGEGRTLRVTLSRIDFWDHRGGERWTEQQKFSTLRDALERGDEQVAYDLFQHPDPPAGTPPQPYTVSVGQIEFDLGEGNELLSGVLDLETGLGTIVVRTAQGDREIDVVQDPSTGVLALRWPAGLRPAMKAVPVWDFAAVRAKLEAWGVRPPALVADGADEQIFAQDLPEDPSCAAGCFRSGDETYVAAVLGEDGDRAAEALRALFAESAKATFDGPRAAAKAHFRDFWKTVPVIDIPNETLRRDYELGMYKFECMTMADGRPAPLQGPWVEDYALAPWSNDYHFNINVQMCYWPAYHGNQLKNLLPLFRMVKSWWPRLRANAKVFVGIDDGFMLPHSVDDRCTCIGGFWSGSIDHASTAWVAQMMFRYVTYSGDIDFLRSDAYPFMKGAMKVYRAMMDERDGALCLPVSTSPEYYGNRVIAGKQTFTCWGVNSSFQLAAAHRLCRDLLDAAEMVGEEPDPMWLDVEKRLPVATFITCDGKTPSAPDDPGHIAVWEETDLTESHRHHSHLAGVTPFDVFDFDDPLTFQRLRESYTRWVVHGQGAWVGWSLPWASMLHAHVGQADAAEFWLEYWHRLFQGQGHGARYAPNFPGFFYIGSPTFAKADKVHEIMQMDSAMAAVAALQEMLVHESGGVVRPFKGTPDHWHDLSFSGLLVRGGFLIAGRREKDVDTELRITSQRGGTIRVESPFGRGNDVSGDDGRTFRPDAKGVLSIEIGKGRTLVLKKA